MKHGILIFLCLLALLSGGCGKVTQDISKTEEPPTFDLTGWISIASTQNLMLQSQNNPKFPSQNFFTIHDEVMHVQILGISPEGKTEELSWGKSMLVKTSQEVSPSTPNTQKQVVTVYASQSYNKTGILIQQSNFKEAKLDVNPSKNQWMLDAKKIKRNYVKYIIQAYSGKSKYGFKVLDQNTVSQNVKVDIGEILPYDTFIANLFQLSIKERKKNIVDMKWFSIMTQLYDMAFFHSLFYALPQNTVKKFDPANPQFEFSLSIEAELLKILAMLDADKEETIKYVTAPKKLELFSDASKGILIQNIQKLSAEK